MNIFVGNLSFDSTEQDVRRLFAGFGDVSTVAIVMDKKGTKSRGFGFVMMADDEQAHAAIAALNEREFMGRPLNVMPSIPKPKEERRREKKIERQARSETESLRYSPQPKFGQPAGSSRGPARERPSRIKGGRRSRSYMRRTAGQRDEQFQWESYRAGRPKPQRPVEPAPWHAGQGQAKPWENDRTRHGSSRKDQEAPGSRWQKETKAEPFWKSVKKTRPWQRAHEEEKPWRETEAKPWKKSEGSARHASKGKQPQSRFKRRLRKGTPPR